MAAYIYTGFTRDGKPVKGIKEAVSKQQAMTLLTAQGILISEIQQNTPKTGSPISKVFRHKKNLADLYFQLSLLLRSGIPLVEAIDIVVRTTKNAKERAILQDTATKVSEGMRFSDALGKHIEYFDPMYVNLVKASEKIGRLADVLMDIAEYEEQKKKNADKLVSALVYPITILLLGLGVLGFMLAVIVPKMQGVFAATKQEIPNSTKILLAVANFSKEYGVVVIIAIILIALGLQYFYRRNRKFRMRVDKRLFLFGVVAQSAVARFSYILAFQLREGLPLTDGLFYATETMSNHYMKMIMGEVREKVQSGIKFSVAVKDAKIFPELFPAAVSTGESSGNMPELLERVNEFYSKRIDKRISGLLSILEPLFIVTIGILVAFVVLSIMQPILNMNTMIG
jgi:type II secretory pathway component PulF